MKRTAVCLLLAAALLAVANPASAFDYRGKAWCCKDIQFCINPLEFDTICSGPGPGADFVSRVLAAAATWNAQGTSFQLVNSGLTNADGCRPDANGLCNPFMDGQNVVSINKACSLATGVLATTYVWFTQAPGQNDDCCVFEADICFSNDFSWYEDPDSLGCPGGCYDVQSVALHEFGHWIVLGHEDHAVAGPPVMQSTLGACVIRRSLFPDDIAGLNYAYDGGGYVQLPFRCDTIHAHPPNYPSSPKGPYLADCPSPQCGCIPGKPWCDSTRNDPCLTICPSDDIVFRVIVKDQCGNPVCDPNCWLDLTNCQPISVPCPTEPFYPIIRPDSCDPATGVHYFSVGAGLLFCEVPCSADIYVDGVYCRSVPTSWLDQTGDLCVRPDDLLQQNPCNDYNCDGTFDQADSAFFLSHLDHCCTGPCQGNGPFCDSVIADPCLNICPEGDVLYTAALRDSCGNPVCDVAGTYIDFSSCQLVRPCPNFHPDWPRVYPDSCDPVTGKHFWSIHAISQCSVCDPTLVITDGNGNQIPCRALTARLFDTDFSMCVEPADFTGQLCNDYDCNGIVDIFDQGIWQNHFGHCCAQCQGNGTFCDSVIAPVCMNICPEGDVVYTAILRDSCGMPVCDTSGTWLDFGPCQSVIPCPGFHPGWPILHPDSCNPATGEHFWSIHAGGLCANCNPVLVVTDGGGIVTVCKTLEAKTYDTDGDLCVDQGDFVAGALCNDYNCDGTINAVDNTIWAPHFGHCCGPCQGNGPYCDSVFAPPCLNICPDGDALYTAVLLDSCGMPVCDTVGTWIDFSNCPDVIPCPNYHIDWPLVRPDSCDPTTGEHFWSIHAGGFCVNCNPALVITPGGVGGVPVACKTLRAQLYDTDGDLCVTALDWIPSTICNDYNCDGIADLLDQLIWGPHLGHCCANLPTDTCEFYKLPYKDYAPQGMPDFDHKQDPNWINAIGQWTHDGPAAVANCLWWFDSKFEPNPVDPRPFGVTPPNDGHNLVTAYGNWDDHDTLNVPPLVNELAGWMSTNTVTSGTLIDSLVSGTRKYLGSRGRLGDYHDTLVHWPSYQYIAGQVLRSCDVIMQIGFYERYADGTCCRIGGHYVTAAGACTTQTVVCISDPYLDQLEGEPPAGLAHGPTVHNDANNISGPHNQIQHDPLPLSPAQIQCLNNGQPVEVATTYPAAALLPNFAGLNGGDPACPPSQITSVIEYAYVICPCCVLRGDANSDGSVNVSDLTYLVTFLFQGGPPPDCPAEADVNNDGAVNIADLTYLVAYLFQGGPPPVPCP